MSDKLAKTVHTLSVLFLLACICFGYGTAVGHYKWWPFSIISQAKEVVVSLIKYGQIVPNNLLVPAPENAPRERFHQYPNTTVANGYYAFMGWDSVQNHYAVWLYNHEGSLLHSWPIDYLKLDSDGPRNLSDMPHGMKVLADGSILVNFDDGDVLARLDACGQAIWKKNGVYHHSIEVAEDGHFWTWEGENTPYGHYQSIVKINTQNGEVIHTIRLIEDIIQPHPTQAMIFSVRHEHPFLPFQYNPKDEAQDLFHPNDVDILSTELADKFPQFNAGDLLISLRTTSLVAVLDAKNGKVKWWSHGPWRYQHDPDFTADGTISIYSNNTGLGRSEILRIDPRTMALRNDLLEGNLNFRSDYMGKHQYLPNGHVLLVNPGEGRAVEVTHDGNKVMEFNNIFHKLPEYNSHLQNGQWLPADYFTNVPQCNVSKLEKETS